MTADMNPHLLGVELKLKDTRLGVQQDFVAGEWQDSPNGKSFSVIDPFDGRHLADVPDLGVVDTRRAVQAAKDAMVDWAARPAKQRAAVLRRWFELIVENVDHLATILTAEQGKPLAEAKGEILSNAAYLEWFSEEAKRTGVTHEISSGVLTAMNRR